MAGVPVEVRNELRGSVAVADRLSAQLVPGLVVKSRADRIRTCDLLVPNLWRYRLGKERTAISSVYGLNTSHILQKTLSGATPNCMISTIYPAQPCPHFYQFQPCILGCTKPLKNAGIK